LKSSSQSGAQVRNRDGASGEIGYGAIESALVAAARYAFFDPSKSASRIGENTDNQLLVTFVLIL
jgi:hypothetical protein